MWKDALLDSLSRTGITPDFGRDSLSTGSLRFTVIEAPEEFNFFIPFHVSIHSIKENHAASIGLSFFYNAKQFQAEIAPSSDEDDRRVNIYETMKFYSLTLEASYQWAIPPEYFSLKGSEKTFVSLALGVSPFQYITRYGDVSAAGDTTRMRAIADTVQKKMMPDFSANGASVSWRMGIGTLKSLASGSALQMGLYYSGAYSGYFFKDGKKVMNSDIKRTVSAGEEAEKDNRLSFLSTRIEFNVTYLVPAKREKKKSQERRPKEEQPIQQEDESQPVQEHQQAEQNQLNDPKSSEGLQDQQEQSGDDGNQEQQEQSEEAAAE